MGNRGHLHNGRGQITKRSAIKRWIICALEYKGERRQVLRPGEYTELFFLDEASALAAGRRPCNRCRPDALADYRRAIDRPDLSSVNDLDAILDAERGSRNRATARLGELPDGSMVVHHVAPHLWLDERLLAWSPGGYGPPVVPALGTRVEVITPRVTLTALGNGYRPVLHSTARVLGCEQRKADSA
jgi:hypothetical protein